MRLNSMEEMNKDLKELLVVLNSAGYVIEAYRNLNEGCEDDACLRFEIRASKKL